MSLAPATNRQVPDNSILDYFNKQTYLGNQYVYSIDTEITSTSEIPFLLLSNPAVSAAAFPNQKALFQGLKKLTCLTVSQSAVLRFYSQPTITGAGTPVTPVNLRPASPNTSIAALSTSPTVSGNGTLIGVLSSAAFVSNSSDLLLVLDPGQNLFVTVQTTSATTFISFDLSWAEF